MCGCVLTTSVRCRLCLVELFDELVCSLRFWLLGFEVRVLGVWAPLGVFGAVLTCLVRESVLVGFVALGMEFWPVSAV